MLISQALRQAWAERASLTLIGTLRSSPSQDGAAHAGTVNPWGSQSAQDCAPSTAAVEGTASNPSAPSPFTGPIVQERQGEPGQREGGNYPLLQKGQNRDLGPTNCLGGNHDAGTLLHTNAKGCAWEETPVSINGCQPNLMSPRSLFKMQIPRQCPPWLRFRNLYF